MKLQNYTTICFLLFLITTMFCCNMVKECPPCVTAPDPLVLRLISKADSSDLITSGFFKKDSIRIYYYDKDVRKDIDITVHTDSTTHKSIIFSSEITWISASGFKDFYLTLNSKVTDTLNLNVVRKEGDCCSYYQYISFKYNKQDSQLDPIDHAYLIKK